MIGTPAVQKKLYSGKHPQYVLDGRLLKFVAMIEDPKLRAYVLENVGKHGFFGYIFGSFRKNYTFYNGNKLNEAFVKNDLNFTQRIKFFFARHLLKLITLFSKKKKK